MSKELRIKGALGKDYQQIYIDDSPTGIFINEDGKIQTKSIKEDVVDGSLTLNSDANFLLDSAGDITLDSADEIVLDQTNKTREIIKAWDFSSDVDGWGDYSGNTTEYSTTITNHLGGSGVLKCINGDATGVWFGQSDAVSTGIEADKHYLIEYYLQSHKHLHLLVHLKH